MGLPWVEKYRPALISDIHGNGDAVAALQAISTSGNMPHFILAGPPGTGKTSSILCLARALLGAQFKDAVLELNASDDRGVDVVRSTISMFAQKKTSLPSGRHKIVVLDEADSMTPGAQQALRRTMETYSATTRFALACNQSAQIIEPIQSRCVVVRYRRLADADLLARLRQVCTAEGVSHVEGGLEAVAYTADGDMRQAVNNLQATVSGFGEVSPGNVFRVCDQPHPEVVGRMLACCQRSDLDSAWSCMRELCDMGYSAIDIVSTVFRVTLNLAMDERLKLAYVKEVGFCQNRVNGGVASRLQLCGLLAKLCKTSTEPLD